MGLLIGNFLTELREQINVSQKDICEGICNISTYSNYERNERIPDFLTLNVILERLGHGIIGLTAYVTNDEMNYLEWQRIASELIHLEKFKELSYHLSKEPLTCHKLNKAIRTQYSLYLKGILAETYEKNNSLALKYYQEALNQTCPFLFTKKNSNTRLGKLEYEIYTLYLRLLAMQSPNLQLKVERTMQTLLKNAEHQFSDTKELIKIYPHLVCIWIHTSNTSNIAKKEKLLEKTFSLLKKERKMYHVTEILRLLIYYKNIQKKDISLEERYYQAICKVYKLFEKNITFNLYEISENLWMFTLIGDYLEKNRNKKLLTQENTSDGICATESYSRIENGKRAPNRKNYYSLCKKLEIEPRYFIEFLNTGNYKAIILRKQISKSLFQGEFLKGKQLLKKLENELGKEKEQNIQYLEDIAAFCEFKTEKISVEQRHHELKKILSYTLNLEDIGKNNHIYTQLEIDIINELAAIYEKQNDYKNGIQLLQNFLNDMSYGNINIENRFMETHLAALNLDKFLTYEGQYAQGNELCMQWTKKAVHKGYATLLDDYLLEISYNLENMKIHTSEYSKELCEIAIDISDIYGTEQTRNEIRNYYKKTYVSN